MDRGRMREDHGLSIEAARDLWINAIGRMLPAAAGDPAHSKNPLARVSGPEAGRGRGGRANTGGRLLHWTGGSTIVRRDRQHRYPPFLHDLHHHPYPCLHPIRKIVGVVFVARDHHPVFVGSVPKELDACFAVVFRKLKDIRSTHQNRGQQRFDVLLIV